MTCRSDEPTPDGATFGQGRAGDPEALARIDSVSPRGWTAESFASELEHEPPTLFVLRSPGQVVAFVVTRIQPPEMDIVNMAVAQAFRRRGLGRYLLRSLLDHSAPLGIRTVLLEVREGNLEARGLYASLGFKETQRRRSFYNEPVEDAILMRLEIQP